MPPPRAEWSLRSGLEWPVASPPPESDGSASRRSAELPVVGPGFRRTSFAAVHDEHGVHRPMSITSDGLTVGDPAKNPKEPALREEIEAVLGGANEIIQKNKTKPTVR